MSEIDYEVPIPEGIPERDKAKFRKFQEDYKHEVEKAIEEFKLNKLEKEQIEKMGRYKRSKKQKPSFLREDEKTVFSIPLSNDAKKLPNSQYKIMLKNEYAAKYLESIGVRPTPANMALVHKLMPIDHCKITQRLKQKNSRVRSSVQIVCVVNNE